ncbi:DUF1223 domain-containing protein [Puia sp. P3]|uniref:DUF1223 domain-containing protein n=1 Tax=Puia sp. P3 TaxID=3423952 RepID=UPI003D6657B0
MSSPSTSTTGTARGWKDRFSNHEFTERQQLYSSWLNLETIYTPQVVVNGSTEYVGSDAPHILKAVSNGLGHDPANNLIIDCGLVGKRLTVNYQSTATEKDDEVLLALVQRSAQSSVRGGENAGRSLSHVQIVRQRGPRKTQQQKAGDHRPARRFQPERMAARRPGAEQHHRPHLRRNQIRFLT